VQVIIIPVADRHLEYAAKLDSTLFDKGIRSRLDSRAERMGNKIRQAQAAHIPCMLIVGDKEVADGTASLRLRAGDQINGLSFSELQSALLKAIVDKSSEFKI
jgi:threonyl-tRNA synthetase